MSEFATVVPRSHPVRLAGLATALPPHALEQRALQPRLARLFAHASSHRWLANLVDQAGIERRYAVRPADWFERPRGWPERAAAYAEGAGALFVDAAERALAAAGWRAREVDTVVTVSSTGLATPTLEARAGRRLGLRADVRRVPVFGLGCAGGVTGLALARRLAGAEPGARVLVVCVETCTLNLQTQRPTKADLVAAVLFADGAAAACVVADAAPATVGLGDGVEHLWPDSLDVMGWEVRDDGLGVVFDRAIPAFVDAHLADAVAAGLTASGLAHADVARFVCHPGGPKVLAAIERVLALPPDRLDHERAVLRACGNMSSPTVLFVLERVLRDPPTGTLMLAALGPGFTASLLPITVAGARDG